MAGEVRGVRVAFVRSGCDFEHSPPRSYIELDSARTGAQILQAVGIVTLVWRRLGGSQDLHLQLPDARQTTTRGTECSKAPQSSDVRWLPKGLPAMQTCPRTGQMTE